MVGNYDHVLVGEELFAASAYLSQDPKQLDCLRGQDFGKLIAIGAIVLGSLFATLAAFTDAGPAALLRDAMLTLFETS